MKNLRIRAYLQTGVISDQFLPLDGVIFYHATREVMGVENYTKPGETSLNPGEYIELPFEKTGKGEKWYYKCSFAQWPENTIEDKAFFVKRFDLQHSSLIRKPKRVYISSGKYKAYHIDVFYRHALSIDWYARGNQKEIERLLQFCTHLGKKTSQGWGAVKEWEVTEWPYDWSVFGQNNKLMRAIPIDNEGFLYGIRPSYWHKQHIFPCEMPK